MNKVCKEANSRSFPNLGSVGMLVPSEVVLYETYLTIADVEQVTGLKNIRQIPFHPDRFLGSDLNFVSEDDCKILSVEFSSASQYKTYKDFVPKNFKSALDGTGEEAFIGPDIEDQAPYLLVFRQGIYTVSMTAATTCNAQENRLTIDQLINIGNLIAKRLI